jgi:multiple sugar transport system substrate-binding protein
MKRRNFNLGLASLAGFGLGALAPHRAAYAAPPPGDTRATLNVFRPASDADISIMNNASQRFARRYPNVEIKVQYVNTNPWGEYINQFMNATGSREPVDIVAMATEGVSTLVSRNLLRDLSPLIASDPAVAELLNDVEPNLLNALRYNGTLNLLPIEWNTIVIYYNTEMFQEAGVPPPAADWTWADLLSTAQRMTKRDAAGNVTQYGFVVPGNQFNLTPWFFTNETDRLTADGHQSNVRDPKFKESLVFLHDMIYRHRVSPVFQRGDFGLSAFMAKQAAMISGTHAPVRIMREGRFTTFDMQRFPRNRVDVAICGVLGIAMAQSSRNPELAWELLKELSGRDAQTEVANNMRSAPSRRSAAELPVWRSFPAHAEIFYNSAARAKPLVAPPNFAQVEEIMIRHLEAYLTNNVDIEHTIENMDGELARAMSRVRWG